MARVLPQAEIGIFGGSGFYELFEGECQEVFLDTRFGRPSDLYTVGEIGGRTVAFLPRHGRDHSIAPGEINYRANLYGMRMLGVSKIIGPCSVGSLRRDIHPGDFMVCDQFVDRTHARGDSFFTHDQTLAVEHLSASEPYCAALRAVAVETCLELGIPVHAGGTVVVIEGPRFSTRAESQWFSKMGWDVVNMTQYPEVWLARELGIHYLNVSLVTDYDAGFREHDPVTWDIVRATSAKNIERFRALVAALVPRMPRMLDDECSACRPLVP